MLAKPTVYWLNTSLPCLTVAPQMNARLHAPMHASSAPLLTSSVLWLCCKRPDPRSPGVGCAVPLDKLSLCGGWQLGWLSREEYALLPDPPSEPFPGMPPAPSRLHPAPSDPMPPLPCCCPCSPCTAPESPPSLLCTPRANKSGASSALPTPLPPWPPPPPLPVGENTGFTAHPGLWSALLSESHSDLAFAAQPGLSAARPLAGLQQGAKGDG